MTARTYTLLGPDRNRVFFADEQTAVAAGYRPCAVCLPDAYAQWKAAGLSEVGAAGDFTQELPRKLLPTRPKEAQRRWGSRRPDAHSSAEGQRLRGKVRALSPRGVS
jgi:Metal binding domain of Ada